MTNPPVALQNQGLKTDEETWSPAVSESSKFACWFLEEGKASKILRPCNISGACFSLDALLSNFFGFFFSCSKKSCGRFLIQGLAFFNCQR